MRKVSELNWPLNTQTQSPARHNYFRFSIKNKSPGTGHGQHRQTQRLHTVYNERYVCVFASDLLL